MDKPIIDRLITELEHYQDLMFGAKAEGDEELYLRAQQLGEETLSQVWEARKQIENNKNKGLYFHVSESA